TDCDYVNLGYPPPASWPHALETATALATSGSISCKAGRRLCSGLLRRRSPLEGGAQMAA
ncbi:MAG: hypothetical protein ACKVKO_10445, partial [Acidimicrobiales bacterium]